MKYLMLVLVMVMSAGAESLYYWDVEGPEEWQTDDSPWHGVKFEFVDFPEWESMTLHELEIGFWSADSTETVRIYIFDGEYLPDAEMTLNELADLATLDFYIPPQDSMNIYELPWPVDVGQIDGIFWVLVYTKDSLPSQGGKNKMAVDLNTPCGHTYVSDDTVGYWNGLYDTAAPYEAHVTVNGYMWTMSLEPATWGSLKTSF